jgi:hypothetical protein
LTYKDWLEPGTTNLKNWAGLSLWIALPLVTALAQRIFNDWPSSLPEAELLERLLALNHERAASQG